MTYSTTEGWERPRDEESSDEFAAKDEGEGVELDADDDDLVVGEVSFCFLATGSSSFGLFLQKTCVN